MNVVSAAVLGIIAGAITALVAFAVVLCTPLVFMPSGAMYLWAWIGVPLGFSTAVAVFSLVAMQVCLARLQKEDAATIWVTVKGVESGRIERRVLPVKGRIQVGTPPGELAGIRAVTDHFFASMSNVLAADIGFLEIPHPDKESQCCYTLRIQCSTGEEEMRRPCLDIVSTIQNIEWPVSVLPFASRYFTTDAVRIFQRKPS